MKKLDHKSVEKRYELVKGSLDERRRRLWAGAEVWELGHGGIRAVGRVTGLAPNTIKRGMRELDEGVLRTVDMKRQRKKGGGRKKIEDKQPGILSELRELVEAHTRADPMRPLRWTSKSGAKLTTELKSRGYQVGAKTVCRLLRKEGYSLQSKRKRNEGRQHPDRDRQFEYIATMVKHF
jgi:transposase